jgi:hypothetical protein
MDSVKGVVLVSLCITNALYTVIRKQSVKSEDVPTEQGEDESDSPNSEAYECKEWLAWSHHVYNCLSTRLQLA